MEDLELAIRDLDRGKSRDSSGYANELLKEEVAGSNLKLATLKLMNLIRSRHKFPEALQALVVNNWRAKEVGGMETALMLWESCCIPSLLHGAGTWVEMSSATEKQLNKLQCWYVRLILGIGQGSPIAALMWDFSLLDMKLRVWREKLMMIIHIRDLDSDS